MIDGSCQALLTPPPRGCVLLAPCQAEPRSLLHPNKKTKIEAGIAMGLFPSTARGNNFAFPPPVQTRGIFLSALSS